MPRVEKMNVMVVGRMAQMNVVVGDLPEVPAVEGLRKAVRRTNDTVKEAWQGAAEAELNVRPRSQYRR